MPKDDIIKSEYKCPNCSETLKEKFPKDKLLVRRKLLTIRLSCNCGYYTDRVIKSSDINKN